MKRKIAIITTSRADYGIYRPVAHALAKFEDVEFGFLVSGTHLSAAHGATVNEIESDGEKIFARIPLKLDSDAPTTMTRAMGSATKGFGEAVAHCQPDMVVTLGDRFEMLAATLGALPFGIPIAHLHGGELSFGAVDEVIRHAMTKLSHLHFVATEQYGRRVAQMGEEAWRITTSGAPALDLVNLAKLPTQGELEARVGISLAKAPLLVTLHPETLASISPSDQADILLKALAREERPIIFTAPNADPGGLVLRAKIDEFITGRPSSVMVESLGSVYYFGMMQIAGAMVGNSSSGIIEAASFILPVVNIGQRQDGRLRAANVVDCGWTSNSIASALAKALDPAWRQALPLVNPYGDGKAGQRIAQVLSSAQLDARLLQKRFVDLPNAAQDQQ